MTLSLFIYNVVGRQTLNGLVRSLVLCGARRAQSFLHFVNGNDTSRADTSLVLKLYWHNFQWYAGLLTFKAGTRPRYCHCLSTAASLDEFQKFGSVKD